MGWPGKQRKVRGRMVRSQGKMDRACQANSHDINRAVYLPAHPCTAESPRIKRADSQGGLLTQRLPSILLRKIPELRREECVRIL